MCSFSEWYRESEIENAIFTDVVAYHPIRVVNVCLNSSFDLSFLLALHLGGVLMKATTLTRLPRLLRIALAITASAVLAATVAEARITKIDITSAESPTFGGTTFGTVGAYEKLRGKAYGEVDPADPRNALITDIELAPRNAGGKVPYSMDIFILKPIDLSKGNSRLLIDLNNRGTMRWDRLNDGGDVNNPVTAADAGTGFLMLQGYA